MRKFKNSKEPLLLFKHDRPIAFINNKCTQLLLSNKETPYVVIYRVTKENNFYIDMVGLDVATKQEAPIIHFNEKDNIHCLFSLSTEYIFLCLTLDKKKDHIFKVEKINKSYRLICLD